MSRADDPALLRRQPQGIIETGGQSTDSKASCFDGSKLNCKRKSIELSANVDDGRHVDVSQFKLAGGTRRALNEQLNGRKD